MAAKPELDERVVRLARNHKWMPPGYQVTIVLLKMLFELGDELTIITGKIWRSLCTLNLPVQWAFCWFA